MNILMNKRVGGAWGYITDGLVNAFEAVGHTVARHDDSDTIWATFKPDLYIGCSGHRQIIPPKEARGNCKVAIHVNPYCAHTIEPNINESNDAISWVRAQQPDVVFGYGLEKDRSNWEHWGDEGFQWVPMATAGDATIYSPKFDQYESRDLDLVYVGGRWPYKAEVIDDFLLPLLYKSNLRYELRGWGAWPSGLRHGGEIDQSEVPALFNRAKVCPCISEPHTLIWGIDLPERVFKVVLSGAIAVHDPAAGFKSYLSTVDVCNDPNDYFSTIKSCCKWPVERRLELAKKQYAEVTSAHTYHHRIATLMSAIGWKAEAAAALDNLKQFIA